MFEATRPHGRKVQLLALIGILAVFVGMRLWCWPLASEYRDVDELSYLHGGLLVMEGMQPSMRHTPAGPQTWIGFGFAACKTMGDLATRKEVSPSQLRLLKAIERTLFDTYRDPSCLRFLQLIFSNALAAVTVAALFFYGCRMGGLAAGMVAGGVYALAPMSLQYGLMSHPYSPAWSFGLLALCLASVSSNRSALFAGISFGLAVSSRLEAVIFLPFVVIEYTQAQNGTGFLKNAMRLTVIAAVAFAVAAPWFLGGLMGGLRNAVAVGVFRSGGVDVSPISRSTGFILDQGLGLAVLLALGSIFLRLETGQRTIWFRRIFVLGAIVVAVCLPPRELRYEMPLLFVLVPTLVMMLRRATSQSKFLGAVLACFILLELGVAAVRAVRTIHNDRIADFSTRWVEENVPSGEKVFANYNRFIPLLPTKESADRLWDEVRGTNAWQKKIENAGSRFGFDEKRFPRAFTEEPMNLEIGNRRCWFILGSDLAPGAPRYDLQIANSIVFGPQDIRAAFEKDGGVLIWRGERLPALGEPAASWVSKSGLGIFVYRRPQSTSQR